MFYIFLILNVLFLISLRKLIVYSSQPNFIQLLQFLVTKAESPPPLCKRILYFTLFKDILVQAM